MSPLLSGPLALSDDGGWLRQGMAWEAPAPFYAELGGSAEGALLLRLTAAGLQARSLARLCLPVQAHPGSLAKLKSARGARELAGFYVAAPLRLEAAALCDRLTRAAQVTGVVDTVRVLAGRWAGHDSGEAALHSLLQESWPEAEPPDEATILGCGPQARSALCALGAWGVEALTVRGATPRERREFRSWLEEDQADAEDFPRVTVTELIPHEERKPPERPSLWISTLPAEMDLHRHLPVAAGRAACLVVDVQRRQAHAPNVPLGFRHVGGGPLLLLRVGLAFAWWFEPPVPWSVLRRTLASA